VRNRQADTDKFRHWEIAGTSHSSRRTSMNAGPLTKRDNVQRAVANCTYPTYPRVPMNYALAAVYDHMTAWVQEGKLPPIAPRVDVNGNEIVRDERGNARGGIRLAEFDPPTALNSGANGGDGFCRLYGRYEPFDDATIAALYPSHKAYADAAKKRIADNLAAGYIVKADADESRRRADQSIAGRGLTCTEACRAAQDLLDSAYFYLGASGQSKKLIEQAARVVRTVVEDKADRARSDLDKWLKDLRAQQAKGRLSQPTVDELATGANAVRTALK
jgi:Alpha/beta hydrolase domain